MDVEVVIQVAAQSLRRGAHVAMCRSQPSSLEFLVLHESSISCALDGIAPVIGYALGG